MAALAHHVPGKWLGHAVLSATFRHPAVLAKAATVLDHATGGRFIVGLGAGWHEPEHTPFGIPLPPMPERFDRFESAVARRSGPCSRPRPRDAAGRHPARPVLPARRRDQRAAAADARRPADLARRPEAARHRAGRGRRRRLAAAGRRPRQDPTDLDLLRRPARRAAARARRRSGRDPATFDIVAQVPTGTTAEDRRVGLEPAHRGRPARRDPRHPRRCRRGSAPTGVDAVARDDRASRCATRSG